MIGPKTITLDGRSVEVEAEDSLLDVALREGLDVPHLCSGVNEGYQADGNCRLCLCEIEGENRLQPSCKRQVRHGDVVSFKSERVAKAVSGVMELLIADQPVRQSGPDPASLLWQQADRLGIATSRYPATMEASAADLSHPAMAVNLAACIHCTNCLRACREEQMQDVIGMAARGAKARIVFDQADDMGASSCVGCGECVQSCPTGALMPKGVTAKTSDRQVDSLCPYCGVGCQLTFHLKDQTISHVSGRQGPANLGRLCVKGRFGFDYVHSDQRLTKPLIRIEGAPKDPSLQADPREQFREASWEEALALATKGFRDIKSDHGSGALAGFGSAKGSNEEAYLFQKLIRTGFGTNNVDHCTRLCHASSVAALMEGVGSGAVTAPVAECANADTILVIGANPTVNHPVAATFIKNAARRGAELFVVDPRGQALARQATRLFRIQPGSDVAFLGALVHVIVNEGLLDETFVAERTRGFEALKAGLPAFAPEDMAKLCGIDADDLKALARRLAASPALMIFWGMGISQHAHGTDNSRLLIDLALLTGNVGRPGAGLHPLRGQNNVQGASDAGLIPMVFPDYRPVANEAIVKSFEDRWQTPLERKAGLTVVEIMDAACDGLIKGLYVMGENPAMSDPDLNHARQGLAKLDHLVVQEIFLTETARLADVILPASAFPEKSGTFTNTDRRVQLARPALAPPGEARQDWAIIQAMANGLGLDWDYAGPEAVFEEMRLCLDGFKGITWDRLEAEDAVTYPSADRLDPGREVLFGETFPTADGLGRLTLPTYQPPAEPVDADYPFVLTTGRLLEHWHTGAMTRRSPTLDALEPDAVAHLHPEDLAEKGLQPGDTLVLTTRRGRIRAQARADSTLARGLVFVPFCFHEGAANVLTQATLDPQGKIPELKHCAVRVEACQL